MQEFIVIAIVLTAIGFLSRKFIRQWFSKNKDCDSCAVQKIKE